MSATARKDVFQAISGPTRREIINLIAHGPMNLNAIADKFRNGDFKDLEFNGNYKDDIIYYVDTKFYNAKDQQLVWSAESKTYDPNNINGFVKGYVKPFTQKW